MPCLTSVCTQVILADFPVCAMWCSIGRTQGIKNIPNRPMLAGVTVSAVHTWPSQVIIATGAFALSEVETTA